MAIMCDYAARDPRSVSADLRNCGDWRGKYYRSICDNSLPSTGFLSQGSFYTPVYNMMNKEEKNQSAHIPAFLKIGRSELREYLQGGRNGVMFVLSLTLGMFLFFAILLMVY